MCQDGVHWKCCAERATSPIRPEQTSAHGVAVAVVYHGGSESKPGHMYGHDGTVPKVASTGASGKKVVSYVKPPNSLFDTWPSKYRSSNGSAVTEMYSM